MSDPTCMSVPEALRRLAPNLSGVEVFPFAEESITLLDHVKQAACTNNVDVMCAAMPIMGTDSMEVADLCFYSKKCPLKIETGVYNIHSVRGLHVVGGAMVETCTGVAFPVSVLYSDICRSLVLHAGGAPIAQLEAEFGCAAFKETDVWTDYVMGSECSKEFQEKRREAVLQARTAGLRETPSHLIGCGEYTLVRHGITPFLSLRTPKNASELQEVEERLVMDMATVPMGTRAFMQTSYHSRENISMTFVASSSLELPHKKEIPSCDVDTRRQHAKSIIGNQTVVAHIAAIVMHCARDYMYESDGCEENNQNISNLTYHRCNQEPIDSLCRTERRWMETLMFSKPTPLKVGIVGVDNGSTTLASIIEGMNLSYTTKIVCQASQNTRAGTAISAVADAVFDPDDAKLITQLCDDICTPATTSASALTALGKCLVDHQALLVLTRNADGRINHSKLVGHGVYNEDLNKDSLSRLLLFPWITVVLMDKDCVSVLLTKSHVHTNEPALDREPLLLRPAAKSHSKMGDSALKNALELLGVEVTQLSSSSSTTLTALDNCQKDLQDCKRKLDYLVECKADAQPDAAQEDSVTSSPTATDAASSTPLVEHTISESDALFLKRLKCIGEDVSNFFAKKEKRSG